MFAPDFYSQLCFADGTHNPPTNRAIMKSTPSDFVVDEILDVEFSGEGEHIWLQIEKTQTHTDQVTKQLARTANIAYKDVGISGMKDFQAKTTQWFSVWLPGVKDADLPDWGAIESEQLRILQRKRHSRKLQRGTHIANSFVILLRDFSGDTDSFVADVERIQSIGVPNYFGEQRFGRDGSNLNQAWEMFSTGKKIKQRQKRSMLLSSARSWLFNCVLSKRLQEQTWLKPYPHEPLFLDGSRSFFVNESANENAADIRSRIESGDIHTSAPLFGDDKAGILAQSMELNELESNVFAEYPQICQGLVNARMDYARRAARFFPQNLTCALHDNTVELRFTLGKGLFATSLLRELIRS